MTSKQFEVFVSALLKAYKYNSINPSSRVPGRGTTHQIDALGIGQVTPPFSYPITLLAEAKYFTRRKPVGIELVRNFYGVCSDIQQNMPNTYTVPKIVKNKYYPGTSNIVPLLISNVAFSSYSKKFAYAHGIYFMTVNKIMKNHKPYFANLSGHTVVVQVPDKIDLEPSSTAARINFLDVYLKDKEGIVVTNPMQAIAELVETDIYDSQIFTENLEEARQEDDFDIVSNCYTYSISVASLGVSFITTTQNLVDKGAMLTLELPNNKIFLGFEIIEVDNNKTTFLQ